MQFAHVHFSVQQKQKNLRKARNSTHAGQTFNQAIITKLLITGEMKRAFNDLVVNTYICMYIYIYIFFFFFSIFFSFTVLRTHGVKATNRSSDE